MKPVRLEPVAPRSRVKHSATEQTNKMTYMLIEDADQPVHQASQSVHCAQANLNLGWGQMF